MLAQSAQLVVVPPERVWSAVITCPLPGLSKERVLINKCLKTTSAVVLFILAEGAIALSVTLSGGALFAS